MIKKVSIVSLITMLVSFLGLLVLGYLFIQPQSKNVSYCWDMQDKGYTSYQDIATHNDCQLINDTNFGMKSFSEVYNDSCRLEKSELSEYGSKCVWGSPMYLVSVITLGIIMVFLMFFISSVSTLFKKDKEVKNGY